MRGKADFEIKDVIVSVACPKCRNLQTSPNYPKSTGWDKKDVKKAARTGALKCEVCGEPFSLPTKLTNLMAEI